MKQKFLLKAMLLLCALIAGSSSVWAADVDGTINFGSAEGSTKIEGKTGDSSPYTDTGTDSQGNTWTITTVTSKSKSFTQNASYSQVGSSSNAVTSITFTTTLASAQTIKAFSAKFGGFSSTAGTVTLKVGDTTVGSGSLNGTSDVTVSASNTTTSGTVLTVTVTGISKGVKAYYISYTYDDGTAGPSIAAPTFSPAAGAVAAGSTVTLSHADADAIRYTTDGTNPTKTTGTVYSAPITITTATTIKAIAIKGDDVSSVASASYTITVAAPTFSPDGGSYFLGTELTLTSAGNTIYYTTDGSNPSNTSTEYTGPIAIATGKITYKAIAYDTYGNASSVTSRTITGVDPATLPFTWDEKATSTTGVISSGVGTYNTKPYLKFDDADDNLILKFDGVPGTLSFDIKGNSFSGGTFKVQTSADGETYTDLKAYTDLGTKQTETFVNELASNVRYIKWIYTNKVDGNVALGNINLVSTVALSPAKEYTTLTSAKNLNFTDVTGLEAYIATAVAAGSVQMTQVNKVPANTGLVLKATTPGSEVNVPVFDGTDADDVDGNKMAGSATETTAVAENGGYILKDGVFQPALAGTLAAGKAYLQIAVSAPILSLDFGNEATNIADVISKMDNVKGEVYNLNGQRVAQPTKGLYIVNGKKVVLH